MSGYQSDIVFDSGNLTSLPVDLNASGYGTTSGTGNDYELSFNPALSAYQEGLTIQVRFHVQNTNSAQLNINGLGAIPIKKLIDNQLLDLEQADLRTDPIYELRFDGLQFQITISTLTTSLPNTGTWIDKGLLDASVQPAFPEGKKGDAYTISAEGFIGSSPENSGLAVGNGDVLYCFFDNDGGFYDQVEVKQSWNLIQAKLDVATEDKVGIARFANTADLAQLTDNVMLSPSSLDTVLAKFSSLHTDLMEVITPLTPSTQEEQLSGTFTIPSGSVRQNEGIKIVIHGFFEHSNPRLTVPANKTFRVYLGNVLIYNNQRISNPFGIFQLEINIFNQDDTFINGFSIMQIQDELPEVLPQRRSIQWATANLELRMSIQNEVSGQINTIRRYLWRVERLL